MTTSESMLLIDVSFSNVGKSYFLTLANWYRWRSVGDLGRYKGWCAGASDFRGHLPFVRKKGLA